MDDGYKDRSSGGNEGLFGRKRHTKSVRIQAHVDATAVPRRVQTFKRLQVVETNNLPPDIHGYDGR